MISLVANIINGFATTLQNILVLTSLVGKIIVSVITWISSLIFNSLLSIILFFQIVYEDNLVIFTEEIPASVNGLVDTITIQLNEIHYVLSDVYHDIYLKWSAAIATVNWLTRAVFVMLSEVLSLLKNTVIFVGDTVWLVVTFIPVHLPQLLKIVFKYIVKVVTNVIIDGYMTLLKFTNYLTEVPLQSFMGIAFTIVIVRLCVHFKEVIIAQVTLFYWSLIRNILHMYHVAYNHLTYSEVEVITQMTSGEDVRAREVDFSASDVDDSANAADALCVICQERQKCVLTLPCRHVCLCTDCCRRLYGYQRTCPICRTYIYHSVTVYL